MCDEFTYSILRKCVAQICQECGFRAVASTVLDTLVSLVVHFFEKLCFLLRKQRCAALDICPDFRDTSIFDSLTQLLNQSHVMLQHALLEFVGSRRTTPLRVMVRYPMLRPWKCTQFSENSHKWWTGKRLQGAMAECETAERIGCGVASQATNSAYLSDKATRHASIWLEDHAASCNVPPDLDASIIGLDAAVNMIAQYCSLKSYKRNYRLLSDRTLLSHTCSSTGVLEVASGSNGNAVADIIPGLRVSADVPVSAIITKSIVVPIVPFNLTTFAHIGMDADATALTSNSREHIDECISMVLESAEYSTANQSEVDVASVAGLSTSLKVTLPESDSQGTIKPAHSPSNDVSEACPVDLVKSQLVKPFTLKRTKTGQPFLPLHKYLRKKKQQHRAVAADLLASTVKNATESECKRHNTQIPLRCEPNVSSSHSGSLRIKLRLPCTKSKAKYRNVPSNTRRRNPQCEKQEISRHVEDEEKSTSEQLVVVQQSTGCLTVPKLKLKTAVVSHDAAAGSCNESGAADSKSAKRGKTKKPQAKFIRKADTSTSATFELPKTIPKLVLNIRGLHLQQDSLKIADDLASSHQAASADTDEPFLEDENVVEPAVVVERIDADVNTASGFRYPSADSRNASPPPKSPSLHSRSPSVRSINFGNDVASPPPRTPSPRSVGSRSPIFSESFAPVGLEEQEFVDFVANIVTSPQNDSGASSIAATKAVVDEQSDLPSELPSNWICPICSIAYVDGSDMIACDRCDVWHHWNCVGLLVAPPESEKWFCESCKHRKKRPAAACKTPAASLPSKKKRQFGGNSRHSKTKK